MTTHSSEAFRREHRRGELGCASLIGGTAIASGALVFSSVPETEARWLLAASMLPHVVWALMPLLQRRRIWSEAALRKAVVKSPLLRVSATPPGRVGTIHRVVVEANGERIPIEVTAEEAAELEKLFAESRPEPSYRAAPAKDERELSATAEWEKQERGSTGPGLMFTWALMVLATGAAIDNLDDDGPYGHHGRRSAHYVEADARPLSEGCRREGSVHVSATVPVDGEAHEYRFDPEAQHEWCELVVGAETATLKGIRVGRPSDLTFRVVGVRTNLGVYDAADDYPVRRRRELRKAGFAVFVEYVLLLLMGYLFVAWKVNTDD